MIQTNLATRPFYNERSVHLVLLLVAILVLAATAFNVTRIVRLSSSDTRLSTETSRNEARTAELRTEAARLRGAVDPKQIEIASSDARQANDLIDRRTFSWTELFNRFESTLPDDVRLTAVRPRLDRVRGIVMTVAVVAKSVDDVHQFVERLEATGAFSELLAHEEERFDDEGLLEASLEVVYRPNSARVGGDAGDTGR